MKYRSDFVTNSSSSSYLSFTIKSNMLYSIISSFKEEYKSKLKEKIGVVDKEVDDYETVYSILNHLNLNDNDLSISLEEREYFIDEPESIEDVLYILINLIKENLECRFRLNYDENDNPIYDENKDDLDVKLLQVLERDFEKIVKSVTEVYGESTDIGWGGDDESRYYKDSYSDDQLEEIYNIIMKEKGCSYEEASQDEDAFADYVGDKTSEYKLSFRYNFGAGVMETDIEYSLED